MHDIAEFLWKIATSHWLPWDKAAYSYHVNNVTPLRGRTHVSHMSRGGEVREKPGGGDTVSMHDARGRGKYR